MVISVCHSYYVLVRDEADAQRVLQLCQILLTIEVSVSMQVLWILVASDKQSRGLQSFHIY